MTRVVWAPQALEDVQAIQTYLSHNSADYADLVVGRIVGAIGRLERHPRSGRVVPEVGDPSLRELVVGNYRIVYRLDRNLAEVLMVFHGARFFH